MQKIQFYKGLCTVYDATPQRSFARKILPEESSLTSSQKAAEWDKNGLVTCPTQDGMVVAGFSAGWWANNSANFHAAHTKKQKFIRNGNQH